MKLQTDNRTRAIFEVILACLPAPMPVYLVGGAVRDMLLGLPVKDLDFVVPSDSLRLARAVRRNLGAAGFTMDDERQTARLILAQGTPSELILDFVSFTGTELQEDLSNRDFTINTLAVALDQPDLVMDFLGGERDLREKRLRAASARSMELDPLRVLRGARLCLAYQLTPETATLEQMRASVPSLERVSAERVRDEIFKIFELGDPDDAFQLMDSIGLTEQVFPEVRGMKCVPAYPPHVHSLWKHTRQVMRYLWEVRCYLGGGELPATHEFLREICEGLIPYAADISQSLNKPVQGNRPRWSLLMLAALYHDAGKPAAQTLDEKGRTRFIGHERISAELIGARARALMLGRAEVDYLRLIAANHMRLHYFSNEGAVLTDRAAYRYFRDLGEAGVDAALLSLVDMLAAYEGTLDLAKGRRELKAAQELLDDWYTRRQQVVEPELLLNGDELQREFGLKPDALIGQLLAALREAQASGEVYNKSGALQFVAKYLQNKTFHERNL